MKTQTLIKDSSFEHFWFCLLQHVAACCKFSHWINNTQSDWLDSGKEPGLRAESLFLFFLRKGWKCNAKAATLMYYWILWCCRLYQQTVLSLAGSNFFFFHFHFSFLFDLFISIMIIIVGTWKYYVGARQQKQNNNNNNNKYRKLLSLCLNFTVLLIILARVAFVSLQLWCSTAPCIF